MITCREYLYSGTGFDENKPDRLLKKIAKRNDKSSSFKVGKKFDYRCFCYCSVRIETFCRRQTESDRAILLLHGGAFLQSSDDFYRKIALDFVKKTDATVFMPDYSVYPLKNPVQNNEISIVWQYISDRYDPRKVAVVGVGAGGNLALVLAQNIVKTKMLRPSSLTLIAPWTDMSASGDSYYDKFYLDKYLGNYVANTPDLPTFIRRSFVYDYVDGASRKDGSVSPLFESMAGLPRALIVTGDYSVIESDAHSLYLKMRKANVDARFLSGEYKIGEYVLFYSTDRKARKDMKTIWKFVDNSFPSSERNDGDSHNE